MFCNKFAIRATKHQVTISKLLIRTLNSFTPAPDVEYLCNPSNFKEISLNIQERRSAGDIKLVHELHNKLPTEDSQLKQKFFDELLKIPNRTHPDLIHLKEPKVIKLIGQPKEFKGKPFEFAEIAKRMHLARTEHLGNITGSRSYYLTGDLALLEHALINLTLKNLLENGFKLISVPDLLDEWIIQGCGMNTTGERTQVYKLAKDDQNGRNLCLSGTAEMSLAGYFSHKSISEEKLPIKVASVSRCFRAEASSVAEERGIFRVHQFTKVEMFALTKPEVSESMLEHFRQLQETNFASLGLHLRTMDMPANELGAPAFRKFDVEAWMPGRAIFGEVSSCSNCTDYQSRRLGIKCDDQFVHTVNGTACAVPRMLIALVETHQNANGTISIPPALAKYFGKEVIRKQKGIPELRLVKNKKT